MKDRRLFLQTAATVGLATSIPGLTLAHAGEKEKSMEEVGATEDLMREHGVLNRILLIYEEGLRRLRNKEEVAAIEKQLGIDDLKAFTPR